MAFVLACEEDLSHVGCAVTPGDLEYKRCFQTLDESLMHAQ